MAAQFLIASDLARLVPDPALGMAPAQAFSLIAGVLEERLGPGTSLLLAEPLSAPGGSLFEWHTGLTGEVRPLELLAADERDSLNLRLRELANKFQELAASLMGSAETLSAGRIVGRIGAEAAKFVDGQGHALSVFLVGGRPVIAGWGLVPAGAPASAHVPAHASAHASAHAAPAAASKPGRGSPARARRPARAPSPGTSSGPRSRR
jgi:hypothetical protein